MSASSYINDCDSVQHVQLIDEEESWAYAINFDRCCREASGLSYYNLIVSKYDPEVKITVVAAQYGCKVCIKSLIDVNNLIVTDYDASLVEFLYMQLLDIDNRASVLYKFHEIPIVVLHTVDDQFIVLQGGSRIQALKKYSRYYNDLTLFSVDVVVKEDQSLPESVKILFSCLCYGPVKKDFVRKYTLTEMVQILKKLSFIDGFIPTENYKRTLDGTVQWMMFCLFGRKPLSMIRRFLLFSDIQYSIVVPAITDKYKTDEFYNILFPSFEMAPRKLFNVLCTYLQTGRDIDLDIISRHRYIADWDMIFWKLFDLDKYPSWHVVDQLFNDIFPENCDLDDIMKEHWLDLFFGKRIWRSIVRTVSPDKRCKKFIKDFRKFLCNERNLLMKKNLVDEAYYTLAKESFHTPYYCHRVTAIEEESEANGILYSSYSVEENCYASHGEEEYVNVSSYDKCDYEASAYVHSFVEEVEDNSYTDHVIDDKQCFINGYISDNQDFGEYDQVFYANDNMEGNEVEFLGLDGQSLFIDDDCKQEFVDASVSGEQVSDCLDEQFEELNYLGLACNNCLNICCECPFPQHSISNENIVVKKDDLSDFSDISVNNDSFNGVGIHDPFEDISLMAPFDKCIGLSEDLFNSVISSEGTSRKRRLDDGNVAEFKRKRLL